MKKSLLSLFVLLALSAGVKSQPELPARLSLNHPEDYQESESLAIDAMEWLMTHPLDTMEIERSQLNVFCMEWLSGHPQLRIETETRIMPYAEKHPELIYIHCYASALAIMNSADCTKLCYNEAGVRAVLRSVGITKGLTSCETLSSIISAADNNQLKAWVTDQLSP